VIAREWFARKLPSWAPSNADKIIQRLENDAFPWVGDRPIAEITPPELLKVLRRIEERGAVESAHRMEFAKDEMSCHGFRAMARTILDEVLQVRPDFIEHQLAHAVRDPNGRAYNRTAHLAERRKMMQQWADYLDKLKTGAEVITLPVKAA